MQGIVDKVDQRVATAGAAAGAWAAVWLVARVVGGAQPGVTAAFVLPVGVAAWLSGWHAAAAVAIVSAAYAGPWHPGAGVDVGDGAALTSGAVFAAVAAAMTWLRHRTTAGPDVPEQAPTQGFGGVARELRTPVQAIGAAVKLLRERLPADGDEGAALGTLERAADRLTELQELLAAVGAELATERRDDEQELVDVRMLAGDVAADLRRLGGLQRLRFDAAHDADVVMSHPDRLRLLMRCLVGDALESAPTGQPVDCSLRRDVGTVVLRVTAETRGATSTLAGRVRLVAAEELVARLGGELEAVNAGGAIQLTVRLPQRRDTDPRPGQPVRAPAPASSAYDVWNNLGAAHPAPSHGMGG